MTKSTQLLIKAFLAEFRLKSVHKTVESATELTSDNAILDLLFDALEEIDLISTTLDKLSRTISDN